MRRLTVLVSSLLLTAFAGGSAAVGCSIYGYGTVAGVGEGGLEAGTDAFAEAAMDGATDADDAGDGGRCAPGMIATNLGCIDAFEVTVDDYAAFVAAKAGNMAGQPPECAWNAAYAAQADGGSVAFGSAPAAHVDWCDALAYCAFKGKHLCGKVGGGAVPIAASDDAGQDEWFAACSHADDGQHVYAYGNTFDGPTCNVSDGGRAPVGSFPNCVGGYPSLFDMTGNVAEWTDSCSHEAGADAATDFCRMRGGSYESAATSTCKRDGGDVRSATLEKVGFRCCAN